jgi:hypothetical protein
LAAFGQYAGDLYINMFLQIFLLDSAQVPAVYAVSELLLQYLMLLQAKS